MLSARGHGMTAARKLHNRISALEPNNVDARLVQGLHDYIVGSLPWHWRARAITPAAGIDESSRITPVKPTGNRWPGA